MTERNLVEVPYAEQVAVVYEQPKGVRNLNLFGPARLSFARDLSRVEVRGLNNDRPSSYENATGLMVDGELFGDKTILLEAGPFEI